MLTILMVLVRILGNFGWLWLVVGGCGWLWVVLAGCGWFWLVPPFSMYDKVKPLLESSSSSYVEESC